MKHYIYQCLCAAVALLLLWSCHTDEPEVIKSRSERTILAIDLHGNIYDINGTLIKTLPDCRTVTQIIVEGEDYFVSGVNVKDKVGYWKNGKWNTLHVDFIDDVDHWTFGIAKWDYNIYLLDYPNVLRNSGIFRLKDSENFTPSRHGISVSEGKCYVVGQEDIRVGQFDYINKPVIYTERKGAYEKTYLPMPSGYEQGQCMAIYAYDRTHFVAGGNVAGVATIWEDYDVYTLPRFFDFDVEVDVTGHRMISTVLSVGKDNGHIYAAGTEYDQNHLPVCILWVDGVPQRLITENEKPLISSVNDLTFYGGDVYVLTQESPRSVATNEYEVTSVIWMNGEPIARFQGEMASIAVY